MLLQEFDCVIQDRKAFENPVVDNLSRIVTSDACESAICDCFPNEQLFGAYMEPWYANIMNFVVTGEMPKDETRMIEHIFFQWLGSSCRMTLTCLNIFRTKTLEDTRLMNKFRVFSLFVMTNLVVGILVGKSPWQKFFKADSIGLPYLEMS